MPLLPVGNLTRRVGAVTLGRSANALALIAINIVLARLFSRADYGTYQQVMLVAATVIQVLVLGLPVSVLYFYHRHAEHERAALVYRTVLILLGLGVAVAAALVIAAHPIARAFHNPALPGPLRIFAVYALAALVTSYYDTLLIARARERTLAWYLGGFALANFLAVLGLALAGRSMTEVLVALAALAVARIVFCLGHTLRILPPRGILPDRTFLISQLAYSLPLGLTAAVGILSRSVDKVVVATFFDPARFAVYANGALEIPFAIIFIQSLATVLVGEFSKQFAAGDHEGALALWHRAMVRAALVVFPLCAVLGVGARDLMVMLFTERYAPSAGPFIIYTVALASRVVLVLPILMALGQTRPVFWGALIDLGVNVGASIALVKLVGFLGPALASTLATLVQLSYFLVVIQRRLAVPVGRLLPWKGLGARFGLSLGPALVCLPLLLLPIHPLLRLAVVASAVGVVWTVRQPA